MYSPNQIWVKNIYFGLPTNFLVILENKMIRNKESSNVFYLKDRIWKFVGTKNSLFGEFFYVLKTFSVLDSFCMVSSKSESKIKFTYKNFGTISLILYFFQKTYAIIIKFIEIVLFKSLRNFKRRNKGTQHYLVLNKI